ncbi:MAG: hypothetical protein NTW87_16045 [Planctomycetota bacterium]|nr:hypothetical protein [Planctomycetota bacterium]
MNTEKTPDNAQANAASIGDRNLERLLTVAYKPEAPSEEFARRLHAAAQQHAAASGARASRGARHGIGAVIAWSALSAAAAAAVVALVLLHGRGAPERTKDVAAVGAPEAKPTLVPLVLQLPKPLFEGTPKALKGITLAKPRGSEPFMVPEGIQNVALKKPVTSSDPEPTVGELKQVTDGDKDAVEGSYIELGPGVQWVQIDLQAPCAIYAIVMWHFHKEARVYRDVVVQAADDADFITNVRTIFNNDTDNSSGLGVGTDLEFLDEYLGKLIDAKGAKARYVRCYSKGNTSNDQNHYTEVEVWGLPAK